MYMYQWSVNNATVCRVVSSISTLRSSFLSQPTQLASPSSYCNWITSSAHHFPPLIPGIDAVVTSSSHQHVGLPPNHCCIYMSLEEITHGLILLLVYIANIIFTWAWLLLDCGELYAGDTYYNCFGITTGKTYPSFPCNRNCCGNFTKRLLIQNGIYHRSGKHCIESTDFLWQFLGVTFR